jgi:hypothetical protein
VTERQEAAAELGELERQRAERMAALIESQKAIAAHNRAVAESEQLNFGTGDQG